MKDFINSIFKLSEEKMKDIFLINFFLLFLIIIFFNFIEFFINFKTPTDYAFEYYLFGKVLISKEPKHCETNVIMRYPKKGKYSHIRPFLDWFTILSGFIKAKFDNKKIFD